MPILDTGIHLVRVTTDDREYQLWVAACPQDEAVELVLKAVPEGWTAALLPTKVKSAEIAALNLKTGKVRELAHIRPDDAAKPN